MDAQITSAKPPGRRRPPVAVRKAKPAWHAWPAEQIWLCPDPQSDAARASMRSALANAVALLPAKDLERVAALAENRDPGAALRLMARLIRANKEVGWQKCRDLAACALFLAVLEHRDERAAIELVVLVTLRSAYVADPLFTYPHPLDKAERVRARMMRCGGMAIRVLTEHTGWGRAVTDLAMLADGDPLGGLDSSGQPRVGWVR